MWLKNLKSQCAAKVDGVGCEDTPFVLFFSQVLSRTEELAYLILTSYSFDIVSTGKSYEISAQISADSI